METNRYYLPPQKKVNTGEPTKVLQDIAPSSPLAQFSPIDDDSPKSLKSHISQLTPEELSSPRLEPIEDEEPPRNPFDLKFRAKPQ